MNPVPAVFALSLLVSLMHFSPDFVSAQIYEWRDEGGARHFTNDIEDVPEALREDTRVVVRAPRRVAPIESDTGERVGGKAVAEPAEVADLAGEERVATADRDSRRDSTSFRSEPRMAQVVYDRSYQWSRSGSRSAQAAVQPQPVVQDVHVSISGPLSVSEVVVAPEFTAPFGPVYQPYGYNYYPYDGPRVATSFDRGRSRHRTVRMRLQEQFHYDRNGPSLYVRGPVPRGPRFSARLPRGLRPASCGRASATRRQGAARTNARRSAVRRIASRR